MKGVITGVLLTAALGPTHAGLVLCTLIQSMHPFTMLMRKES